MSKSIEKICEYCGCTFVVPPSSEDRRFCSQAHYWEFRKLPIKEKTCNKCGETKLISEFSRSNTKRMGRDGYRAECKTCQSTYRVHWYQNNRDKSLEYAKDYVKDELAKNPDFYKEKYARDREKILERKRRYDNKNRKILIQKSREAYWSDPDKFRKKASEWANQNKEKTKIQRRRYREENREVVRARHRRFYQNNPNKAHEYQNRRRAAKRGNGGSYTTQEWQDLCEFYGNVCLCCGVHANDTPEGKLSPDHVIPLSRGGSNDISNIQPLCYKCNLQKYTSLTDYRPHQFKPRYQQLGFDL